jgi:hypothetical protein
MGGMILNPDPSIPKKQIAAAVLAGFIFQFSFHSVVVESRHSGLSSFA